MKNNKLLLFGTLFLSVIFLIGNVNAAKNTKGEKFYDFSKVNGGMSFNEDKTKIERKSISGDLPEEKELKVSCILQQNNYFSGPASTLMVLKALGYNDYTQDVVAKIIGTDENGTGAGQEYIPNGLNSIVNKDGKMQFNWTDHKNDKVDEMKLDIMDAINYGKPVIINSYEAPGDVYIHGHDIGIDLYNFGVISAYHTKGDVLTYLDTENGLYDGFIRSKKIKTKDMGYAVEGRGYIW